MCWKLNFAIHANRISHITLKTPSHNKGRDFSIVKRGCFPSIVTEKLVRVDRKTVETFAGQTWGKNGIHKRLWTVVDSHLTGGHLMTQPQL